MSLFTTALERLLPDQSREHWRRIGFWTAVLITLWIVVLHVINLFHAGPLWRDEADSANFASMPTLRDIWHNLRNDLTPILFVTVARVWTLAGLNSDFSYRVLGFLTGMGTLGLLWWGVRKLGGKMPLLALALYATSPVAIRVGDSLRPYGLGIALNLLTLILVWNFVEARGWRAFGWAALAATLSVQCLYQNAFFVLAYCCAAWVVTLGRKDWKTALRIGAVGLVAALSVLPYWNIITKGQGSLAIRHGEIAFGAVWTGLCDALQTSGGLESTLIWLILYGAGVALAVYCGTRQQQWNMVYCAAALVTSATLYLIFLDHSGLPPRVWYFLIIMAPSALALDAIFGGIDRWRLQFGRAIVSAALIAASAAGAFAVARVRQTNVDLVAAALKAQAQPGDFILVSPWYYGVSLRRYIDPGRLTTVPPMDDFRVHRYDLEQQAMMQGNPMKPILEKARATLRSGHRVWAVGIFVGPSGDEAPPVFPPYTSKAGMSAAEGSYFVNWLFQIAYFVDRHTTENHIVALPVPDGIEINSFEDLSLHEFHGWRE